MPIVVTAAKGGSGATVVAAALAAHHPDAVLLDLAGDVAAVFGRSTEDALGVTEWLASRAPAARLDELVLPGRPGLITQGSSPTTADQSRHAALVDWACRRERGGHGPVVVDLGLGGTDDWRDAATVLRVTRPCYLALRPAASRSATADGVVLITEPGRSLGVRDVERALGAPVVATMPWDPAVARAVDAGLDTVGVPTSLRRLAQRLVASLEATRSDRFVA